MISVIVPVYNVKTYLRKCLDSIVNQTFRDLEILIIDDGSTDGSGDICDEYRKDVRVKVFHTNNRGLSCARNLGLDSASGDWIGFVDSDDWIEPDMYEVLIRKSEETEADVVECGYHADYANASYVYLAIQRTVSNIDAKEALIRGEIGTQVWNKIWRSQFFNDIRFPEGRFFEDIATSYKLVGKATVTGIADNLYHWMQRKSGISQSHDQQNLIDYWLAHKQRYEDLKDSVCEETKAVLLQSCAYAIARTWVWNLKVDCPSEHIDEMNVFVRNNYPTFGCAKWPLSLKATIFLARFKNKAIFFIAYILNQLYRTFKPKYYV
jgi:glycosyltransferase involved in cell wall biosynthesis